MTRSAGATQRRCARGGGPRERGSAAAQEALSWPQQDRRGRRPRQGGGSAATRGALPSTQIGTAQIAGLVSRATRRCACPAGILQRWGRVCPRSPSLSVIYLFISPAGVDPVLLPHPSVWVCLSSFFLSGPAGLVLAPNQRGHSLTKLCVCREPAMEVAVCGRTPAKCNTVGTVFRHTT